MATNASYGAPAGQPGSSGAAQRTVQAALPHIDDLKGAPADIDVHLPIKSLLEMADTSLRQAEMSREFNKPAIALKSYIRAYTIAIDILQRHKDYPLVRSDRGGMGKLHASLLKRINQQQDAYEKIKKDIIQDNQRTGVRPKSSASQQTRVNGTNGIDSSGPRSNGHVSSNSMSSSGRTKPVVNPKPQSLQGNSVSVHSRSSSVNASEHDLTARFANLRGPQPSPGQDPRIKTHPIMQSKPAGPREMPPPSRPKIDTQNTMPLLPKMPDAIYTPTRTNSTGDVSRPPPSTPRSTYSRSGSIVSINGTVGASQSSDYFSSAPSYVKSTSAGESKTSVTSEMNKTPVQAPAGDIITAEELFEAMKHGSVLILDIRRREDYDDGHIMTSSTMCIEPNVLLREDLTADDIAESLVLSPSDEQNHFENRNNYDLVVFHDDSSEAIDRAAQDIEQRAIASIHRALVHLNYGKTLRHPPKLLQGGIAAWVDLMGSAALQTSKTSSHPRPQRAIGPKKNNFQRRRSENLARYLRPGELKSWQEKIEDDNLKAAQSPTLHRSMESFLRRYPAIEPEQESMTSSPASGQRPRYGVSHKHDLTSELPSPPARPAPALPRSSYSSISAATEDSHAYEESAAASAQKPMRSGRGSEVTGGEDVRYNAGLINPHNWCYACSTLQSLLASPGFGRELAQPTWKEQYKAPMKADEEGENSQLMIQIMSSLFHWMRSGKMEVINIKSLMGYSRSLCKAAKFHTEFGGTQQQDAQEFMSFIMDHIHDETNVRRDRKGNVSQPDTKSQPLIKASAEYWQSHLSLNSSIVDRYWRGLELSTVECQQCHTKTYTFSPFEWIPAPVNMNKGHTLSQALSHHIANNTIEDFSCDKCRCNTKAVQSISFARLPPLLCICFRRFNFNASNNDIRKSTAPVTWDFNDFDFSPYFIDNGATTAQNGDRAFEGPFRYECYAVIVHAGSRTDNGHYFAYVRDSSTHDPYAWLCCNDTRVSKVRIGSGDRDDIQSEVFKSGQDRVPYLVFFRRKGGA